MGDSSLQKCLDDYKLIYMAYRNFTDRTREEYKNDLEDFIEYAAKSGITRAGDVGLSIVQRFVASLEERGLTSLTRKRKVVVIRSFLSFLYQDDYIAGNIASKIVLPFTEAGTPHVLTQTECEQLRATVAGNPRDLAIIEVLLQTGMRLSELTHLTLNDLDLGSGVGAGVPDRGSIRILGIRGRKARMIPINGQVVIALKGYLEVRDTGNNALFINRFGVPLGKRGVQKMLKKYLERAEISRASVHTLKHTFTAHQRDKKPEQ